jgi:hypothetical protein
MIYVEISSEHIHFPFVTWYDSIHVNLYNLEESK